nr:adenylyl-sulfate kinase [uncultured Rhodoferax sp.]
MTRDLTAEPHALSAADRTRRFGHTGAVIWLTGLSGAGKSTLAMRLEQCLFQLGHAAYVLDGDNVRAGLNSDLGFSNEDRCQNIRRVGEVAALFADAGLICITAFISPFNADRQRARMAVGSGRFFEVYLTADLAACEARDKKGLYRKARAGELHDFTGIDSPYEVPVAPDLVLDTSTGSVEDCLAQLMTFVQRVSA